MSMMPALLSTLMVNVLPADTITKSNVSRQRGLLSLYFTLVFCVSLGLRSNNRNRTTNPGGRHIHVAIPALRAVLGLISASLCMYNSGCG
jgi:hypothetical protein